MGWFKHKGRVVRDDYNGYEAQIKFWWLPFIWWQLSGSYGLGINSFSRLEDAIACAERGAKRAVVWRSEDDRQVKEHP